MSEALQLHALTTLFIRHKATQDEEFVQHMEYHHCDQVLTCHLPLWEGGAFQSQVMTAFLNCPVPKCPQ